MGILFSESFAVSLVKFGRGMFERKPIFHTEQIKFIRVRDFASR